MENPPPGYNGPFIKAAIICDRVLTEPDGVLSPIRVIDRLNVQAAGPGAPETMPVNRRTLFLVVMLVRGEAQGGTNVRVQVEDPAATLKILWDGSLDFLGGPENGHNL